MFFSLGHVLKPFLQSNIRGVDYKKVKEIKEVTWFEKLNHWLVA